MTTLLKTAIGQGDNAFETAKRVAREALTELGAEQPDLSLVFCGSKYDYEEVVAAVREVTGNAPLLGCSTAGEFTQRQVSRGSIAVGLFKSDEAKVFIASAEGLAENPFDTVAKAVSELPREVDGYPHLFAILLHDGLAGKGEETVLSAAAELGSHIKFVGGSAGDDLQFISTSVFVNDTVSSNSVGLALVASQKPIFTGVQHGHSPLSPDLVITKAVDNVLYTVNDRPAYAVWYEYAAEPARKAGFDIDEQSDAHAVGSFLIAFELGLDTGEGKYKVRVPLSKNEDGSLNFACTIPEGATFRIMQSPKTDQIASAEIAAKLAMEQAGDHKLAGALVFDCCCRGIILGEDFEKGVAIIKQTVGDIPLLGWETYGEICMDAGQFSGFHNTTTVVALIPE